MVALERSLRELAQARQKLSDAQARKAEVEARMADSADGQELVQRKADVGWHRSMVADAENSARTWAVCRFADTGNKRPAEGASIRMTKFVDICGDMEDVKAWAMERWPHVLRVHTPTLKKQILIGGAPKSLAVIREEPRGAISKDLSMWLEEEGDNV